MPVDQIYTPLCDPMVLAGTIDWIKGGHRAAKSKQGEGGGVMSSSASASVNQTSRSLLDREHDNCSRRGGDECVKGEKPGHIAMSHMEP